LFDGEKKEVWVCAPEKNPRGKKEIKSKMKKNWKKNKVEHAIRRKKILQICNSKPSDDMILDSTFKKT